MGMGREIEGKERKEEDSVLRFGIAPLNREDWGNRKKRRGP